MSGVLKSDEEGKDTELERVTEEEDISTFEPEIVRYLKDHDVEQKQRKAGGTKGRLKQRSRMMSRRRYGGSRSKASGGGSGGLAGEDQEEEERTQPVHFVLDTTRRNGRVCTWPGSFRMTFPSISFQTLPEANPSLLVKQ